MFSFLFVFFFLGAGWQEADVKENEEIYEVAAPNCG